MTQMWAPNCKWFTCAECKRYESSPIVSCNVFTSYIVDYHQINLLYDDVNFVYVLTVRGNK